MKIEFYKVTWYSWLIAIILFVFTFVIAFYLGKEFEKTNQISRNAQQIINKNQQQSMQDKTSNQKTYTNNKYGFEFTYPIDWNISESFSNGLYAPFPGPPERQFSPIFVEINKKWDEEYLTKNYPNFITAAKEAGWPIDAYCSIKFVTTAKIDEKFNENVKNSCASTPENFKIDGSDVKICELGTGPAGGYLTWVLKDDKAFFFGLMGFTPEGLCDKTVFKKMLSTFKFTN